MGKQTKLYNAHVELKAKLVPFAGWDMPVQYSSVKEEVLAVRNSVGVFDVSHMGEFFVEGPDAIKFVDYVLTNDFANADLNKAVYSPLCRENGTVIDDLIAYKLAEEKILICVNAANIEKDFEWLKLQVSNFNCELTDHSSEYSLLAVQGPQSVSVLKELGIIIEDNQFPYYSANEINVDGVHYIIARTGYTGEDGFELFCKNSDIEQLWSKLMSQNVIPCGLAARDVLRMEVGYPLYGHEIYDEVTPLDSGLKWTVKMDKPSFIGKEALVNYAPKLRLAKLILDKGIPREGYLVENEEGETVGKVLSGTMSVVLGKGIAICHVEKEKFPDNKKFFINIRNKKYEATYTAKAFVSGGHK